MHTRLTVRAALKTTASSLNSSMVIPRATQITQRLITTSHFISPSPPMAPPMAPPAATTASRAVAPWRAQFLEHVGKMDQPSFTFTSQHPVEGSSAAERTVPRARTCIMRGMWASLPQNEKNKAPRNPDLYESDLPVLTTDARMDKVPEIFASGGGEPSSGPEITASGGGGPVEAMFWVTQTQTQWRIRGHAWVLSPSDMGDGSSAGAAAAREALSRRMRKTGTAGSEHGPAEQWSWEREIVAHFGNLSPGMRGSFKNPSPGTPRANEPGPGEGLGQKVGDELLKDEVARKNFRVVVIVPDEVDMVDLSDPSDQRRWLYTFVGPASTATRPGGQVIAEWERVELWP